MVELVCVLLGAGGVFSVDLDLGQLVDKLKDAIKATLGDLVPCAALLLDLYLARQGDAWLQLTTTDIHALQQGRSVPAVETMLVDRDELHPASRLHEHFGKAFAPQPRDIHLLVTLPTTKKRPFDALTEAATTDGSVQWLASFRTTFVASSALPLVEELTALVASPLPLKVGIKPTQLDRMTRTAGDAMCTKLAFVDESAPCRYLWETLLVPALANQREHHFHHVSWDMLVRELFVRVGTTIHTGIYDAGTASVSDDRVPSAGTARHGSVFTWGAIRMYRADDDSNTDRTGDQASLEALAATQWSGRAWSHGDAVPYVFGCATEGFHCALFALSPADDRKTIQTTTIATFQTNHATDRVAFVLAALQLCRLMEGIGQLSPDAVVRRDARWTLPPNIPLLTTALGNLNVNELGGGNVKRGTTLAPDDGDDFAIRGAPVVLDELFRALESVLVALVRLHSLGWMHRDLRWSVIAKHADPTRGWCLLGLTEAAAPSPQTYPSGAHLSIGPHAPEMFTEGGVHTTAVDVYGVGHLIRDWNLREATMNEWTTSPSRQAFVGQLLNRNPKKRPTAEQALVMLKQLEREYYETEDATTRSSALLPSKKRVV